MQSAGSQGMCRTLHSVSCSCRLLHAVFNKASVGMAEPAALISSNCCRHALSFLQGCTAVQKGNGQIVMKCISVMAMSPYPTEHTHIVRRTQQDTDSGRFIMDLNARLDKSSQTLPKAKLLANGGELITSCTLACRPIPISITSTITRAFQSGGMGTLR